MTKEGLGQSRLSFTNAKTVAGSSCYLSNYITQAKIATWKDVAMQLSVAGEKQKTVTCNARVAWINQEGNQPKPEYPVGAGLQFLDTVPEDMASIESCLALDTVS